ncbi:MAG TPA: GH3 auxin-responsive promoter family protein [Candidatus Nitrosotenuis sp.]|jgi:hypothetical protein|nr:GH3 auxin-responsive promoter family protein [Candidatus Nitrosotenuis sp.]
MWAPLAWKALCLPEALAFHRATRQVARTQRQVLGEILRREADCQFGQRHGFARLRSVREFQERVPLAGYEDYRPFLERMAAGERGLLTAQPVLLFEPTSGSATATKLIPYTPLLKAQYRRALAAWMADLFGHRPQLLRGRAYWSVSPAARAQARTPGGTPIGFEDDSQYLGFVGSWLVRAALAVPPAVRRLPDIDTFRYVTLLHLLACRDLTLISVWNPSFLTLLLERLPAWGPRLVQDLARGTLSAPGPVPEGLGLRLRPHPARARQVETALARGPRALWPRLGLVSCWTEAQAAAALPRLGQLLPGVFVQGKGLLATEGVVSFPLHGQPAPALALRSHFFEFLLDDGSLRLAHELEEGQEACVVLTTGGGLYRYRLGDRVRVVGHLHQCPLLSFLGRESLVGDRFGEKLHEHHVRRCLQEVLARRGLEAPLAMLAFEPALGAYALFIEAEAGDEELLALGRELEEALADNFHYRYCRDLGQLGELRVFRLGEDGPSAYLRAESRRGLALGDIKPLALHPGQGWSQKFRGRFLCGGQG